jgi:hypothetical protein
MLMAQKMGYRRRFLKAFPRPLPTVSWQRAVGVGIEATRTSEMAIPANGT